MNRVHACTEAQENLVIVFGAFAELARQGERVSELESLFKTILETPLGQNVVHHLPRTKAAFAPAKQVVSLAVHLQGLVQYLRAQLVRDG